MNPAAKFLADESAPTTANSNRKPMPTSAPSIQSPRTTGLAIGALLLFIAAYFPALRILVQKWAASEEYGHAFLTVPIILYMVWQQREPLLAEPPPRSSSAGLALVVFATLLYFFALLTEVHTMISLAMVLTIVGALIFLAGPGAVRLLFTPLLLLVMLIPVPDQLLTQLTFPLQLKVSQVSEWIIRMCGITILREGNIMTVPGKSFEVAGACSGLRAVVTLLTLSVIMGHYMLRNKVAKLLLVAASVPTAILVNIVRVVAIVLLFAFFGLDLSEGTIHEATGIAVFLLALFILILLQRILESWQTKEK